jgi:hypothetical protein
LSEAEVAISVSSVTSVRKNEFFKRLFFALARKKLGVKREFYFLDIDFRSIRALVLRLLADTQSASGG